MSLALLLELADIFATVMSFLTCEEVFAVVSRVSRGWRRGTTCDLLDMPRLITSKLPLVIPTQLLRMYMSRIQSMELNHSVYAEWLSMSPVYFRQLRQLKTPYIPVASKVFPLSRIQECELTYCEGIRSTPFFTNVCRRLSKSVRVLKLESVTRERITTSVAPLLFRRAVFLRLARITGRSTTDLWLEVSTSFPALRILSVAHVCDDSINRPTAASWRQLTILRLTDTSITDAGLDALLRATHGSVVHLKLRRNRQLTLSTLIDLIALRCPRLLTLDIEPCYFKLFRRTLVMRGLRWTLCRQKHAFLFRANKPTTAAA